MPAYPTHTFFTHCMLQALLDAQHPIAPYAANHDALFRIAGIAGCDIQCMPYQVCSNCNAPYRHNQKQSRTCLVCKKEELQDFTFKVSDGRELSRTYLEQNLYGNTHLVLYRDYQGYGVPPKTPSGPPEQPFPDQVIAHLANCVRDSSEVCAPGHQSNFLAFTAGWFTHVVSDALFKGVYPQSVKINFFGEQYSMKMLPAAETLTMTDLSYDFGVHWPSWHDELIKAESDGGALRHIALGNHPDQYDPQFWTNKFGKPDPAIGRIIDAVQPINRKWFREMYVQPDYTAPTPRLDAAPLSTRATWRFGENNMSLGQLRRYALTTGWYDTFITGADIYVRAVKESWDRANLRTVPEEPSLIPSPGIPSWSLWKNVVADAIESAPSRAEQWGSQLQIDPGAIAWLRDLRDEQVTIRLGPAPTEYQQQLAEKLTGKFHLKVSADAETRILIGPPAFNLDSCDVICTEDALRLKYERGLAGLVLLEAGKERLLISGFSDFGDHLLANWIDSV